MALRERRRLKRAVEAFERAVAEEPTSAAAWFWLAATRDNRALEHEAIPAYERALDLGLDSPDEAKAWTWLGSSYSKAGRHTEALRAVERAETLGGYEPIEEFRRVAASVRRRSARVT
jgi:tetratricopeptide (TPR) repeat protein